MVISNSTLDGIITEAALLGNSLLPFVIGAYFAKNKLLNLIKTILEKRFNRFAINVLMCVGLVAMFVAKTYVPSLYVAIFTGIGVVVCYWLIDKPKMVKVVLAYLGNHSSNIWLTHMFFYMIFPFFKYYIYYFSDPILIFCTLLLIFLLFSYFINSIGRLIYFLLFKAKMLML